ncbi:hypothetical protein [Sphingomonas sp. dw_22]|uniref:hypothetical protein n=1 Tax=Sphingomonas sp. dw_22 TaxID=2721175 RepID=UPI001BD406DE|nr:hypothetical protein [Sphingomonas sp. dw_22]
MRGWILLGALALAACGETTPPVRPASYVPVPTAAPAVNTPPSIVAIKGETAPKLIAQFGTPAMDVSEGSARKLQFAGPICVLDAYLYPPANGRGEQVVTWLDTRQRNGAPIDQASCVAALTKRPGVR